MQKKSEQDLQKTLRQRRLRNTSQTLLGVRRYVCTWQVKYPHSWYYSRLKLARPNQLGKSGRACIIRAGPGRAKRCALLAAMSSTQDATHTGWEVWLARVVDMLCPDWFRTIISRCRTSDPAKNRAISRGMAMQMSGEEGDDEDDE